MSNPATAHPANQDFRKPLPQYAASYGRSLSVVIPAYNEEARIPSTLSDFHAFLLARVYDGEIIVVNDGSSDGTRQALASLEQTCPSLRVVDHIENHGKGFAVKTGILAATREAVLFCDADHSTPISDVDRLWPWYDRGFEVVCGLPRFMTRALTNSVSVNAA